MTHQHAQHITSFTLLRRRVQGVYITKVYLLVCECVILKYSKLANEINNTSIKNQSVLVPCAVLPVQIRPRPFRGVTNINVPCFGVLAPRKIHFNIVLFCFFHGDDSKKIILFFKNKSFTQHHLSLSYITYKNKIVFILRAKRLDECAFKNTLLKKLLTKIITNNGGCFGKYNYIIHRERVSA
tara:strand:+ start:1751 stop:2299 length:549 start_codon:yes stop_codon:yes gene_type:complete